MEQTQDSKVVVRLTGRGSSTPRKKKTYECPGSTSGSWTWRRFSQAVRVVLTGRWVKLGTWLDNVRTRAMKLPEQRLTDLDQLGMCW
ncbi:helicase associated domain-containing protein [Streptomyces sp. NPDC018352]|uniref:helicase associated domain-containing protein n=1 Tax=Streptomyces sp. NPDC018352 TaxID=3157194 RepID=UPI0033DFA6DF